MLKPLSNRLAVKPIPYEEQRPSGLYIPPPTTTFSRESPNKRTVQRTVGEVVAVGPGKWDKNGNRFPVDASPGDIVTFSDSCSTKMELDGETYLFIREDDIIGFLDRPANVEQMN